MSIISTNTVGMNGPVFLVQPQDTAGKIKDAGTPGQATAPSAGPGSAGNSVFNYTATTTPSDYGFAGTQQPEAKYSAASFDPGADILQAQSKVAGSIVSFLHNLQTAQTDLMAALIR